MPNILKRISKNPLGVRFWQCKGSPTLDSLLRAGEMCAVEIFETALAGGISKINVMLNLQRPMDETQIAYASTLLLNEYSAKICLEDCFLFPHLALLGKYGQAEYNLNVQKVCLMFGLYLADKKKHEHDLTPEQEAERTSSVNEFHERRMNPNG